MNEWYDFYGGKAILIPIPEGYEHQALTIGDASIVAEEYRGDHTGQVLRIVAAPKERYLNV